MTTALITGVLGQDGSYLAEHLLSLGYKVIGISRRKSTDAISWGFLEHLKSNNMFQLVFGDITDSSFVNDLIIKNHPDELYLLAAQSHVKYSFENPVDTLMTDAVATVHWLEAVRKYSADTRIYFAATSELYGGLECPKTGYNETSPFNPRSPYACAKLCSYSLINNYKEAYNLYACSGILFNHSSPRRGLDFVEKKITHELVKVKTGKQKYIVLGNMDAVRDLGHSKDYIKAMHLMLQQDKPVNYVVATGKAYTIRYILNYVCEFLNLYPDDILLYNKAFERPSEVPFLLGDSSKIKQELLWQPEYSLQTMLDEMIKTDINYSRSA